jgi:hypothetical protein
MIDGHDWKWIFPGKENVRCDSLTEWEVFSSNTGVDLKLRDADGYWAEMAKHNVTSDMIAFDNERTIDHFCTDMPMGETPIRNCPVDGRTIFRNYPGNWHKHIPSPLDKFGLSVTNGKDYNADTVRDAVKNLQDNINSTAFLLDKQSNSGGDFDDYDNSLLAIEDDIVVSYGMAIFLFAESVDGMKTAIDQANEDVSIRHKQYVDNILSILNTVLSGVGLAMGLVGAAEGLFAKIMDAVNIVVMLAGMGDAIANIALHPDDIFGAIMFGLSIVSGAAMMGAHENMVAAMGKLGKTWRENLGGPMAGRIGPTFKSYKDKLDKIVGSNRGGCK